MHVEPAAFNDHVAIARVLREAKLPLPAEGDPPVHMLVVRDGAGEVLACAGWEVYGASVLLRSVAVKSGDRRGGLGRALVSTALEGLREGGVHDVFLLTTDAVDFFARLGFDYGDRDAMP